MRAWSRLRMPWQYDLWRASHWPRGLRVWLWIGILTLVALSWLGTGTRSPYAITTLPKVEACGNLVNPDHEHFLAIHWMLEGRPKAEWGFSVVLRRVPY